MTKYLRLYKIFINNAFSYEAQYRADTWIKLVVNALWVGMLFLTIEIFFQFTAEFNGWHKEQVYLLTAVWIFMDELFIFLFRDNLYQFSTAIVRGELDNILTKPVSSLFMMTCKRLLFRAFYRVVVQIAILAWLFWHFDFALSWSVIPLAVLAIVLGLLINYSFGVLLNTLSFWLARIENINDAQAVAGTVGRFPLEIFPRTIKIITFTIVPIAFSAYVPVVTLVGKAPWQLLAYTICFAIIIFGLACLFWNFAIQRYSSASS